jgi:hypothetical protein
MIDAGHDLSQDEMDRLEQLSVHLKLEVLCKSAVRRGPIVRIHLDSRSKMMLFRRNQADACGYQLEIGETWRGFQILVVREPIPRAPMDAKPTDRQSAPPQILTVEVTDHISGRVVYFNWHSNPEGYR